MIAPAPMLAPVSRRGGVKPSSLLNGLVSYWKLEETSGTRFDSVTASANHMTDNNGVGFAAGRVGNAASFGGPASQRYLSHADNPSLSLGNIDFTFSAWIKPNGNPGTNGWGIVGSWTVGGQESAFLWLQSNRSPALVLMNSAGSYTILNTTFNTAAVGVWSFLVAWHDSVADKVWINIDASPNNPNYWAAWSTGVRDSTGPFMIGRYDTALTDTYFDGAIDEVGFWKRVLTDAERAALYNGGNGVTYPFIGVS
jgi:hypothetical protein